MHPNSTDRSKNSHANTSKNGIERVGRGSPFITYEHNVQHIIFFLQGRRRRIRLAPTTMPIVVGLKRIFSSNVVPDTRTATKIRFYSQKVRNSVLWS